MSSCSGCPTQGTASPINRPDSPVYPKIKAKELACLEDDVYNRLDDGRIMCRNRVKTLEQAIDAHNNSLGK